MKYLRDGRQVEVVYQNDEVIFVQPVLDDCYDPDYTVLGPIEQVDKVYDEPQMYHFHQRVTTIKSNIHDLNKQLEEKNQELGQVKADIRDLARKNEALLKRVPYLDRIEAFLDDKITHVVEIENQHVEIKGIEEYDEDRHKRHTSKYRMFALVGNRRQGKDKGIRWAVNEYREGSGYFCDCIPCLSYDEAKEIAFLHTLKNISQVSNYRLKALAKNHGFVIPENRLAEIEKAEAEEIQKKLEEKKKEIDKIQAEICSLEGNQ